MTNSELAATLGKRTERVYQELINWVDRYGYVPSYEEIGQRVGCSASTVMRHLDTLQKAGLIERRRGQSRSITIRVA